MASPVILFDYDISPFGQKIRWLLDTTGIPYKRCIQPPILPRPILANMGITYRRIPVLAIGKNVFCDSSLIVSIIQEQFAGLPSSPADKAYEIFGITICWLAIRMVPQAMMTPEFIEDRKTIFPVLLTPNYSSLRPSALAEFRAMLTTVEDEFLGASEMWINGPNVTLADIHVFWSIRWILYTMGISNEPGFQRSDFPKIYKCLDNIELSDNKDEVTGEEATKTILEAAFLSRTLDKQVPEVLDIPLGSKVSIESTDAVPGAHPQIGVLFDLGVDEVVVELKRKVKLHFPRRGYTVSSLGD